MRAVKQLLSMLLYPRARLSRMPSLSQEENDPGSLENPTGRRGRLRFTKAFFNLPLVFGGLIVTGLFLVVLFGPVWATSNPYIASKHIQPHLDSETGEWISPPLEPSEEYPLGTDEYGNDILSMMLYGARNTLIAAAFIAMARIILGVIFGAYAGWNEGSTGDRSIMGAIGVIAAIPALIIGMILIYALDIRRGLPVFIVALTVIGWTEIAQYIRGEFLVLRKRSFIEGAHSAGATNLAIAVRHVLPNLLPTLLVITFLEVAAVLLLFGELGFVGVYIGGGSHISIGDELTGTQLVTLSEVPEWGAMLAEGYRWLRAKPFIVYPPAAAFFIAVVGFTALGEGLRRFIESHHVSTNFLLRKRMLVVVVAITVATVFIINNTGPAPWLARVAEAFDADSAYGHTQQLTEMDGRGPGQAGAQEAANYIAEKFEQYGLNPGWLQSEYIYPMENRIVRPVTQPELVLLNDDGDELESFHHQLDFGFMTEGHGGSGSAEYPITFLSFTEDDSAYSWESYRGLDLADRIILLIEGNAPSGFTTEALIRGAKGVLWITGDAQDAVRSQVQLAYADQLYLQKPTLPILRIRPEVAQAIVTQAGLNLSDLASGGAEINQRGPGWIAHDLDANVRMTVDLSPPEETTTPVVLGHLLGSDFTISNELVVVLANYDGLGIDPDGTVYEGANHNAAGVSIMLEVARLWQQEELDPRRSVLFIAWGGGSLENSGMNEFLANERSFRHLPAVASRTRLSPSLLLQLDYIGAGGDTLLVQPGSQSQLIELLEESASDVGIAVNREPEDAVPMIERWNAPQSAWLSFAWDQAEIAPTEDVLERIEPEKLQAIGQIVSHVLTQVVRQTNY
ncbi:MAG: ABC transporter permease subunit [Candidatus Promineifilaceae bacterium]